MVAGAAGGVIAALTEAVQSVLRSAPRRSDKVDG
jgi:hypothetical protein